MNIVPLSTSLSNDNKSILRFFKLILQRKGYITDTAETGKEALEKISGQFYDWALIDAQIEGVDAYLLKPIKPNELLQIMAN